MLIYSIAILVLALAATLMQMRRDLMMMQQNSYRNERYRHWMSESGESTRVDRLVAIVVAFLCFVPAVPHGLGLGLIGLFAVWALLRLCMAHYKKPLVVTNRVKRIYAVMVVLLLAILCLPFFYFGPGGLADRFWGMAVYATFVYAFTYCLALASNWLLKPVEAHINKGYYDDAARILASMPDLTVVGITGSYGKTSTKHYLHRILSEQFETLMTPGNFNTTLGVIRTVREHMKPYTQVFIAEMGAKQPGDIKEICDLVHPRYGIITAVGPQHLESFKTIENVQATKFELADALPADGMAVVNNDFEYIANRPVSNTECKRYAVDADADYRAVDVKYTPQGTTFAIVDKDGAEVIRLQTKLVGSCNVSNLMAAVIVALRLGVPNDKIRYAVEKIEQVEHRLNVKRTAGGITLIDDAYNSNPVGSKMALEVLKGMDGGKRIIITPGMIELGADQYDLNKAFGEAIPGCADVAIIVGEYNRQAILEGVRQAGMDPANVHAVATFDDAQRLMLSIAKPGDTVLYENDLPDTFK